MTQKALGKHYRKGVPLIEIVQMFPDDASTEEWFIETRWPDSIHCPHCGSTNIQVGAKHKTMAYRCRDYKICGKRFSIKTATVMEHSNFGYQVWATATYLLITSLKCAHKGTFHKISHKYLDRYVTEFAGKHNSRSLDTIDQMRSIAQGMVGKQLKCDYLVV